jgi:hypothetical protein
MSIESAKSLTEAEIAPFLTAATTPHRPVISPEGRPVRQPLYHPRSHLK